MAQVHREAGGRIGSFASAPSVVSTTPYTFPVAGISQTGLSSLTASRVSDGDTATNAFHTDSAGIGSTLTFDLGTGNQAIFDSVSIWTSGPLTAIWSVQASVDGTNWSTFATGLDVSGGAGRYDSQLNTSTLNSGFRYWRLYKTNAASGGSWHTEVQFFARTGGTATVYSQEPANIGTAITGSGLSSLTPSRVSDGDTATNAFHTDTAGVGSTLTIDLGSGNEKSFWKCKIYLSAAAVTAIWNIQASNNGTNWDTYYTGFNVGASSGPHEAVLAPQLTPYRYWRLYKTNAAAGGGWHNEVNFFEVIGNGILPGGVWQIGTIPLLIPSISGT